MASRFRVLVALDETAGGLPAYDRALDLLRYMPNLEITAFARTLAVPAGGGTLLASSTVSDMVTQAAGAADDLGVSFKVRETAAPVMEILEREAHGHDLVVLPHGLAQAAERLAVPTLLV